MASAGLIAAVAASAALLGGGAKARNDQMKAKSEATQQAGKVAAEYQQAKQDARNNNQAPNAADLDAAKQRAVFDLQRRSGRASTFLSNRLGG